MLLANTCGALPKLCWIWTKWRETGNDLWWHWFTYSVFKFQASVPPESPKIRFYILDKIGPKAVYPAHSRACLTEDARSFLGSVPPKLTSFWKMYGGSVEVFHSYSGKIGSVWASYSQQQGRFSIFTARRTYDSAVCPVVLHHTRLLWQNETTYCHILAPYERAMIL